MADPKKVRWSQLKVGIVGIAAFLILAVLIFLLTSSRGFFQKNAILYTYDVNNNLATVKDAALNLTTFTYDTNPEIERMWAWRPPLR